MHRAGHFNFNAVREQPASSRREVRASYGSRISRIFRLLPVPKLRIASAVGQENFVRASLNDLARFKYDNLVRFGDRAQTVRNRQHSTALPGP